MRHGQASPDVLAFVRCLHPLHPARPAGFDPPGQPTACLSPPPHLGHQGLSSPPYFYVATGARHIAWRRGCGAPVIVACRDTPATRPGSLYFEMRRTHRERYVHYLTRVSEIVSSVTIWSSQWRPRNVDGPDWPNPVRNPRCYSRPVSGWFTLLRREKCGVGQLRLPITQSMDAVYRGTTKRAE